MLSAQIASDRSFLGYDTTYCRDWVEVGHYSAKAGWWSIVTMCLLLLGGENFAMRGLGSMSHDEPPPDLALDGFFLAVLQEGGDSFRECAANLTDMAMPVLCPPALLPGTKRAQTKQFGDFWSNSHSRERCQALSGARDVCPCSSFGHALIKLEGLELHC
jgi:hypothetical protein